VQTGEFVVVVVSCTMWGMSEDKYRVPILRLSDVVNDGTQTTEEPSGTPLPATPQQTQSAQAQQVSAAQAPPAQTDGSGQGNMLGGLQAAPPQPVPGQPETPPHVIVRYASPTAHGPVPEEPVPNVLDLTPQPVPTLDEPGPIPPDIWATPQKSGQSVQSASPVPPAATVQQQREQLPTHLQSAPSQPKVPQPAAPPPPPPQQAAPEAAVLQNPFGAQAQTESSQARQATSEATPQDTAQQARDQVVSPSAQRAVDSNVEEVPSEALPAHPRSDIWERELGSVPLRVATEGSHTPSQEQRSVPQNPGTGSQQTGGTGRPLAPANARQAEPEHRVSSLSAAARPDTVVAPHAVSQGASASGIDQTNSSAAAQPSSSAFHGQSEDVVSRDDTTRPLSLGVTRADGASEQEEQMQSEDTMAAQDGLRHVATATPTPPHKTAHASAPVAERSTPETDVSATSVPPDSKVHASDSATQPGTAPLDLRSAAASGHQKKAALDLPHTQSMDPLTESIRDQLHITKAVPSYPKVAQPVHHVEVEDDPFDMWDPAAKRTSSARAVKSDGEEVRVQEQIDGVTDEQYDQQQAEEERARAQQREAEEREERAQAEAAERAKAQAERRAQREAQQAEAEAELKAEETRRKVAEAARKAAEEEARLKEEKEKQRRAAEEKRQQALAKAREHTARIRSLRDRVLAGGVDSEGDERAKDTQRAPARTRQRALVGSDTELLRQMSELLESDEASDVRADAAQAARTVDMAKVLAAIKQEDGVAAAGASAESASTSQPAQAGSQSQSDGRTSATQRDASRSTGAPAQHKKSSVNMSNAGETVSPDNTAVPRHPAADVPLMRTLKQDMERAVAHTNSGTGTGVPRVQQSVQHHDILVRQSTNTWLTPSINILIGSGVFVVVLLALLLVWYFFPRDVQIFTAPAYQPIEIDETIVFDVDYTTREALVTDLHALPAAYEYPAGTVAAVRMSEMITLRVTGEPSVVPVDLDRLLTMLSIEQPDTLRLALQDEYLLGFYQGESAAHFFLIFETEYRENGREGMLEWEERIARDLDPLIPQPAFETTVRPGVETSLIEEPSQPVPPLVSTSSVGTSTVATSTTSTSTQEASATTTSVVVESAEEEGAEAAPQEVSQTNPESPTFAYTAVEDIQARALRPNGTITLAWYMSNGHIVIAGDERALHEITNRLEKEL